MESGEDLQSLSNDRLVHIDEALQYNTSFELLAEDAFKGNIELLFECSPVHSVVLRTDRPAIGLELIGLAATHRTPDYLVLEPAFCTALKFRRRGIKVYQSAVGYRATGHSRRLEPTKLMRLSAVDASQDSRFDVQIVDAGGVQAEGATHPKWAYWGFHADGRSRELVVERGDLYVRNSQLIDVLGLSIDEEPSTKYLPAQEHSRRVKKSHHSSKLLRMFEAADKFWGDVDVADRDQHPDPKIIERWFTQLDFSASAAEAAVALIRPDDAGYAGGRRSKT